ncbi:hypothetical protein ACFE04_027994 [Oxalis oulophora]
MSFQHVSQHYVAAIDDRSGEEEMKKYDVDLDGEEQHYTNTYNKNFNTSPQPRSFLEMTTASVSSRSAFLGVDVGTGSARAGLFDDKGKLLGSSTSPIQIWKDGDCIEKSSKDICHAVCEAVKSAYSLANISWSGDSRRNVIVWMDHRAVKQAEKINSTTKLDESMRISKETITILKDQVFGFDTFFVTSHEPYETNGVVRLPVKGLVSDDVGIDADSCKVFVLFSDGLVYILCPVVPFGRYFIASSHSSGFILTVYLN